MGVLGWAGRAALALTWGLLVPAPVGAEEPAPSPRLLQHLVDRTRVRVRLRPEFVFAIDPSGADARLATTRGYLRLRVPLSKRAEIDTQLRIANWNFDFDGESELITGSERSGTPFGELYDARLRMGTNFQISDAWFATSGMFVRTDWEEGADLGEATRGGAYGGFAWQPSPNFFLGLGIGLQSKLGGDGVSAVPLAELRWKVREGTRFVIRNRAARIVQRVAENATLEVVTRLEARRFRLEERNGAASGEDLEWRLVPIFLRYRVKPAEWLRIDLEAGASLNQRLRSKDGDRHHTIRDSASPLFRFEIQTRY